MPVPDVELPPLYQAVLTVFREQTQQTLTTQQIGEAAWERLTLPERCVALPQALGSYASSVFWEQREQRLQQAASNPSHTYLEECDIEVLQVCAAEEPDEDDYVPADKPALVRVLAELDLLQHRLAMRDKEIAELRSDSDGH